MKKLTRQEWNERIEAFTWAGQNHPHLKLHVGRVIDMLENLFEEGEKNHEPKEWETIGITGNLVHFDQHMNEVRILVPDAPVGSYAIREHLLHAIARLMCARELMEDVEDV